MGRGPTCRTCSASAIHSRATGSRAHPAVFAQTGNYSSRADPARGSRTPPNAPACPPTTGAQDPAHAANPRVCPLSPQSAMTGLSHRRSRVRVPSLPSFEPPPRASSCSSGLSLGGAWYAPYGTEPSAAAELAHESGRLGDRQRTAAPSPRCSEREASRSARGPRTRQADDEDRLAGGDDAPLRVEGQGVRL